MTDESAKTTAPPLRGIWSAAVTPIGDDLQPDAATAVTYYKELLDGGCDGINLLGTTGEAMSLSATQRRRFMEAIASSDLPSNRIMAGTGAASLDDAVTLTRTAMDCGFAAALVLPPFFYREPPDDGVVAYFDALFSRLDNGSPRVLLYNFPAMSGTAFHSRLVDRLVGDFGDRIAGIKDSSNDLALETELFWRHPHLAVFPGSEQLLVRACATGGAGCISGSVCLWPRLAQQVYAGDGGEHVGDILTNLRATLDGLPLIPAVRYLIARTREDERWAQPLYPLMPLAADARAELERRLEALRARDVPAV